MRYAAAMNRIEICRCPQPEFQTALKCLHAGLSLDQQAMLVRTLDQLAAGDESAFSGLLVAKADDKLIAATWVQFTPGHAAIVWPPSFDSPAAGALMIAVADGLDQQHIALAQILFSASDLINEEILSASGFYRLADLAYLTLERTSFPKPADSNLRFEPHADQYPDRLASVIARSYQATLDCPELNALRDPKEVIEGYKVQGQFDGDRWFFVRADEADVGCLILAEHPPGQNWELVYMGVVPESRGRGYGEEIVRFAVDKTRQSRAERLVLAVDERNQPALEMYRRIGFVMWDRRSVFARMRKQAISG
jgi:mycothiol synthase